MNEPSTVSAKTASLVDDSNEHALEVLFGEAKDAFGRVIYAQKVQEKSADYKRFFFGVIRTVQTVLSAISSTGFIVILLGKPEISATATLTAGVTSLLLTAINLLCQNWNAMDEVEKHRVTAAKLWLPRDKYLSLLTDIVSRTIAIEDVKLQRTTLQNQLAEIYKDAPRTDALAYWLAQFGLKKNEEFTFKKGEVNEFLFPALKKEPQ